MKRVSTIILGLVILFVLPLVLFAQEGDPEPVVLDLAEAVNAGDVEAALALFHDDAVITIMHGPLAVSGTYTGSQAIRAWQEELVAQAVAVEVTIDQVEGNVVTARNVFSTTLTRRLGIAPLQATDVITVADGQIAGVTSTMTDESRIRLRTAMAQAAAQEKVVMPAEDSRAIVHEATVAMLSAYNVGDVNAYVQHFHPLVTGFDLDGELLVEGIDPVELQARYDAGFKPSLQVRHLDVRLYGDTTVVTGYLVGSIALPVGATRMGTWRYSAVWMQYEGDWKMVHYHLSPLTPAYGQNGG